MRGLSDPNFGERMGPRPKASLKAILEDPEAKKALELLTRSGASREDLLVSIQCAVDSYLFPESYDMFVVDGMTREGVRGLPDQLRWTARTIEMVNDNPHLEALHELSHIVSRLPSDLRRYADSLERTIKFGRQFMKKNPKYWDFQAVFKRKLLSYVCRTTGRPQYAAVANLLNAAVSAAGIDDFVEPSSLRKLFIRRPKIEVPNRKRF